MSIPVKIKVFEGPLDLLLHLIDKHKLNIYDIPIAEVTDQYLEYIRQMKTDRMEIMSEFIEMAAILINIKSKMLLPVDEIEEEETGDPRQELMDKLIEYRKFKLMASQLKELQGDALKVIYKDPTIPEEIASLLPVADPEKLLSEVDFSKLYSVFKSVMKKKTDKIDPIRSKFGEIKKEEFTVEDKINEIKALCERYESFSFKDLLEVQQGKVAVIVTFLAILELMKMGLIEILQETLFDDILIKFIGRN
ncbi:MAG: segregation/condensation protein A [Firmicutes bacterium HGW-Firmicutes-1]|jgi:segregation and condensation protein A|nr:MAG: segregation/condensation protein A [Firmicutes bacterium HGW-Firmicutes-1]